MFEKYDAFIKENKLLNLNNRHDNIKMETSADKVSSDNEQPSSNPAIMKEIAEYKKIIKRFSASEIFFLF